MKNTTAKSARTTATKGKVQSSKSTFSQWIVDRTGKVIRRITLDGRESYEAALRYRDEHCPDGLLVTLHLGYGRKRDAEEKAKVNAVIQKFVDGNYDFALDGKTLDTAANWDRYSEKNPIAQAIDDDSSWITDWIASETGELIRFDFCYGTVTDRNSESHLETRLATNEECCQVEIQLGGDSDDCRKTFDIRKPITRPAAAWIRQIAERLAAAADKIEAIEDDRNLKLLRRFVAGDPAAKYSGDHMEMVDIRKPLPPIPDWVRESEPQAEHETQMA